MPWHRCKAVTYALRDVAPQLLHDEELGVALLGDEADRRLQSGERRGKRPSAASHTEHLESYKIKRAIGGGTTTSAISLQIKNAPFVGNIRVQGARAGSQTLQFGGQMRTASVR